MNEPDQLHTLVNPLPGSRLGVHDSRILLPIFSQTRYVSVRQCFPPSPQTAGRTETINVRATRQQTALIDQAAEALGRSRSDFMLDTVCREAESVLLDRRYFALSEEAFRKFTTMLDRPPKDNPKLRRLLETKAPWER